MNRLDRFVIVVVLLAVAGLLFGRLPPIGYDPSVGRRPLPPAAVTPQPPSPQSAMPVRQRRPLPIANPSDPLIAINAEGIPTGKFAIGTSFAVGNGVWLTARHLANESCAQVSMMIDGRAARATIAYLHPDADLAILRTQTAPAAPLAISSDDLAVGQSGFAFGFPSGALGGFEGTLMGRSRMQLGGHLQGVAPVLTWAEVRRVPDELDSLGGISGGPIFDENGNVIGIAVAASVRRGRNYTVAPEILRTTEEAVPLFAPTPRPAREVAAQPIALGAVAAALSSNGRIAKTACRPS
jgi:S1-C subfamily serine protease